MRVFSFRTASSDSNPGLTDELTAIREGDEALRSRFIERYTNYIVSTASRVKGRYIQIENDEEYSVALSAFNRAIDLYDPEKGASFFTFAGLLIKRGILDLYKKSYAAREVAVSQLKDGEDETELEFGSSEYSIRCQEDSFNLQQEISIYKALLNEYSIDFKSLASVSPKHAGVRRNMMMLAKRLSDDPRAKADIIRRKTLPLKDMQEWAGCSRTTLERHRKYILANFILINSDLDYLKDYIKEALQGGENA